MRIFAVFAVVALAGCQIAVEPPSGTRPSEPPPTRTMQIDSGRVALFQRVVRDVEPVAERVCREELPRANCDFRIVVDDRAGVPPNAFQTLDENGRPVIGFTAALIADAANADELAFVLGHEAAHHIEGHIPQTQQQAAGGALIGGLLGTLGGFDAQGVETISRIGATVGARRYSKDFELEADRLGTIITLRAGYDPVRGAEYFARIPDPGNRFLGTHPPNAQRIETVRRTAAGY